ncbi:MAG: glycosyltransferase family 2 [Candidatus Saccharibacteria bacterium]|jgi:cellulose synthase/poly-beta-1,6-N-acetylglucosamine synthase-like glycosyltransferase|nr:glycosyltransferase family 2 [Candidatus Saccharibacteria bacterium]
MRSIYSDQSAIAGPLTNSKKLNFKPILSKQERAVLYVFLFIMLGCSAGFAWFLAGAAIAAGLNWLLIGSVALVLLVEFIRLLQSLTLWVFAKNAKDPVPMVPETGLRIAVLTTIVPGKEPMDLVATTLRAMKQIDPGEGNTMDVWLLDEGDSPEVKAECEALGVKHFSRKGVAKWNTASGPFKAKTKHGNHNSWRSQNEQNYDIVAQMDPDHVPESNFLTRTLGYFADPDVGFVVAPQVYGNLKENWIAKASAFQAYIFHGIIQRGGNGMGAPLLIGTNHLYRTKAFASIGGYQDSIIEDHLTSMVIFGSENIRTGNKWKGVYTPDILAVGEGPTSFTDYFNQQKRWAYGIWEIATKSTPSAVKKLTKSQSLTFLMLQSFYPTVAISWLLSTIVTLAFGFLEGTQTAFAPMLTIYWALSIVTSLWFFFWLRRFNLVEHERKDWGIQGMGLLLMCIPVYFSAAWEAITRKPLTYAVTAKGDLATPDTIRTFKPHINWFTLNLVGLFGLSLVGTGIASSEVWTVEHMALCLLPVSVYLGAKWTAIVSKPFRSVFASLRKAE